MILYDPSPSWQMQPVRENVRKAICYENTSPMFFGFGGGRLKGPHGHVVAYPIAQQHALVQADSRLHEMTARRIEKLVI